MLVPMGAAVIIILFLTHLPEPAKPPISTALATLPRSIDPLGFLLFGSSITMILLALTWGGGQHPWSSPLIVGLLCGGIALLLLFGLWVYYRKESALITPSCLSHRAIYVGGVVVALQGGASQAVPFYLPLWLQAVKGDGPKDSAVHLLPSLVTNLVALIVFGALVRKLRYVPPWAVVGSAVASVGAGLMTTLKPGSSVAHWVGYQIVTSIGRGISFQAVSDLVYTLGLMGWPLLTRDYSRLRVCKSLCLLRKTPWPCP